MFKEAFEKSSKINWKKHGKELKEAGKETLHALKGAHKSGAVRSAAAGAGIGALSTVGDDKEKAGVGALRGAAIGAGGYYGFKNRPKAMILQSKGGEAYVTNRGAKIIPKGKKVPTGKGWDQNFRMTTEPSIRKAVGGAVIAGGLTKRYGPKHKDETVYGGKKKDK